MTMAYMVNRSLTLVGLPSVTEPDHSFVLGPGTTADSKYRTVLPIWLDARAITSPCGTDPCRMTGVWQETNAGPPSGGCVGSAKVRCADRLRWEAGEGKPVAAATMTVRNAASNESAPTRYLTLTFLLRTRIWKGVAASVTLPSTTGAEMTSAAISIQSGISCKKLVILPLGHEGPLTCYFPAARQLRQPINPSGPVKTMTLPGNCEINPCLIRILCSLGCSSVEAGDPPVEALQCLRTRLAMSYQIAWFCMTSPSGIRRPGYCWQLSAGRHVVVQLK